MAKNELVSVSYESMFGDVQLDAETVKKYLVKGNGDVSDEEVFLFVKMCQTQKLNPFVTGEVYLIKFGTTPAQMVVGYDTYKRRADENPCHLYTESGIVVCRSNEIVQKQGACLYPSETLVGGWCRVHKLKDGREVETYKEVSFSEYNKNNAIWKEKPCTMIEKVAISQALREAYPRDYEGLYTKEELAPAEYEYVESGFVETDDVEPITKEERQMLFERAQAIFGVEEGNEFLKKLLAEEGLQSTTNMTKGTLKKFLEILDDNEFAKKTAEILTE